MIQVPIHGLHSFVKTDSFTKNDRQESFWHYRCSNCGLTGRRLTRDEVVFVSDTFSDVRILSCTRDNFQDKYLGKQIQTCCKIKASVDIPIYSIHTVIKPPIGYINGERGVWVLVGCRSFQILFDEFVYFPILPRQKPKIGFKRKIMPKKVGFTRTIKPRFKRTR